jgi:hypothetical protein
MCLARLLLITAHTRDQDIPPRRLSYIQLNSTLCILKLRFTTVTLTSLAPWWHATHKVRMLGYLRVHRYHPESPPIGPFAMNPSLLALIRLSYSVAANDITNPMMLPPALTDAAFHRATPERCEKIPPASGSPGRHPAWIAS